MNFLNNKGADSAGKLNLDKMIKRFHQSLDSLVGCKAPDFSAKTMDGKSLSMSQLKGKVIVMNFWFNTCEPCVAEIPALDSLVASYSDTNVVFMAFSRDYAIAVNKFLEYHKFNYKMVSGEYDVHAKYCPPAGYPTNMVIDKKGILRLILCASVTAERANTKMKPTIDKCLEEK